MADQLECRDCGKTKPTAELSTYAGNPTDLCIECKAKRREARAALRGNGGGSTRKKKKRAARRIAPADTSQDTISIEPSLGFKAELLEDDRLSITQDNHEAEADCVVLSRTDFKIIRGQFADWADPPPTK